MKFFKLNIKHTAQTASIVMASVLMLACASQKTSTVHENLDTESADKQIELMASEQYLPVRQFDEQNNLLPYQPQENPYLAQKKQVDKGSVLLFIEAKQALRQGEIDIAKQKLNVIIRNDKELSGPWMMLGDIAQDEKNYDLAQQHYQQGLLINPKNVNGYTALARIQRLKGQYKRAQNTLVAALELWSDFPEAHYNLSILFDVYLNQTAKAKQHLAAFILLEGSDEENAQWLQRLNERLVAEES